MIVIFVILNYTFTFVALIEFIVRILERIMSKSRINASILRPYYEGTVIDLVALVTLFLYHDNRVIMINASSIIS